MQPPTALVATKIPDTIEESVYTDTLHESQKMKKAQRTVKQL